MKTAIQMAFFFCALVLVSGVFATATAQGPPGEDGPCSMCTACEECESSRWGGNSCNFKGPAHCPCELGHGLCNPASALNIEADDRRVVETGGGISVYARLTGEIFGTWECHGELRDVFRVMPNGVVETVESDQLPELRRHYRFDRFVAALSARLAAAGPELQ